MDTSALLSEIDAEIKRLERARTLLGGVDSSSRPLRRRGISAAGRRRIAEAQRKRWAALKKVAK